MAYRLDFGIPYVLLKLLPRSSSKVYLMPFSLTTTGQMPLAIQARSIGTHVFFLNTAKTTATARIPPTAVIPTIRGNIPVSVGDVVVVDVALLSM